MCGIKCAVLDFEGIMSEKAANKRERDNELL